MNGFRLLLAARADVLCTKGRSCIQELACKKIEVQICAVQKNYYSTSDWKYRQNSTKNKDNSKYSQPKNRKDKVHPESTLYSVPNSKTLSKEIENINLDSHQGSMPDITTSAAGTKGDGAAVGTSLHEEQDEPVDFEAVVRMEIEMQRQQGDPVPTVISPEQFEELLSRRTYSGRRKFLHYLFVTEKREENDKLKKELRAKEREKMKEQKDREYVPGEGEILYGIGKNSVFRRIQKRGMNDFYRLRLVTALQFGQPFVVDMSFDQYMSNQESKNCCQQICVSIH